jgi:16S rRNA (guanine1207-N2)-methyltransferase
LPAIIYGSPPRDVIEVPAGAAQASPLAPGSLDPAALEPKSLDQVAMLVPPGAVEGRYALALGLRALRPGATLVAAAPKDKGGLRLRKTLTAFGCEVAEEARRHHRICTVERPAALTGI